MTSIEGASRQFGAVLATHVALEFVDRRGLRAAYDIEPDSLVRVAAKTPDFQIGVAAVQSIANCRGWDG
jgi:hypothetical protein